MDARRKPGRILPEVLDGIYEELDELKAEVRRLRDLETENALLRRYVEKWRDQELYRDMLLGSLTGKVPADREVA